jgi:ribose/xylose/arabinose/galactoside ABC-type transport system permease subunit
MRQSAGVIVAAAVVAAAIYLTVEFTFFDQNGEARPDLSVPSIVLLGLLIAGLMGMLVGLGAEVRHLRRRAGPRA